MKAATTILLFLSIYYIKVIECSTATDAEIADLTEKLFVKEVSQMQNVYVNLQGKTRSSNTDDNAPENLLDVDDKVFDISTISKMVKLFDNYVPDTLTNEVVTSAELQEESEFLTAVINTPVMQQLMTFLVDKGVVSSSKASQYNFMKELWFTQYSRGKGKVGSSGFEHVFVHEVKNGGIIGLHNWVYFYLEEQAGRLDYKGYIKQQSLGKKGQIIKTRFEYEGLSKPVNSLFIGTSPEMELALYTLCFALRADKTCTVSLGGVKFGVVTYSWSYKGKSLIGSAYPEI